MQHYIQKQQRCKTLPLLSMVGVGEMDQDGSILGISSHSCGWV